MGFTKKNGKKQKNTKHKAASTVKVDMHNNPLYPPKKESDFKEILTAAGTTVVSVILVGIIVTRFSYISSAGSNYDDNQYVSEVQEQEEPVWDEKNDADAEEESDYLQETAGETEKNETLDWEAEKETEEEAESEYVIEDSNSRYISTSELAGLSKEELSHARNEIYARHGRRFQDAELQSYFDSKSWYQGTIEPEQFSEGMLNDYEKANAETILAYEKSKGYK